MDQKIKKLEQHLMIKKIAFDVVYMEEDDLYIFDDLYEEEDGENENEFWYSCGLMAYAINEYDN